MKDALPAEISQWVAVAAFAASTAVFVYFVVMALRMPHTKVKHDSELPLHDEKKP